MELEASPPIFCFLPVADYRDPGIQSFPSRPCSISEQAWNALVTLLGLFSLPFLLPRWYFKTVRPPSHISLQILYGRLRRSGNLDMNILEASLELGTEVMNA